jgi:hypothetical protein
MAQLLSRCQVPKMGGVSREGDKKAIRCVVWCFVGARGLGEAGKQVRASSPGGRVMLFLWPRQRACSGALTASL